MQKRNIEFLFKPLWKRGKGICSRLTGYFPLLFNKIVRYKRKDLAYALNLFVEFLFRKILV